MIRILLTMRIAEGDSVVDVGVSVIVPTYNRKTALRACLRSLEAQTTSENFEVIVVDDGSTDGTVESLAGYRSAFDVQIVRADHRGPSNARNIGISIAKGEILAFTEDDVVVAPRWLELALVYLGRGADVVDGQTVYAGTNQSVRKFENVSTRPPAFIPCNLILRRAVYEAVGGYDPAFFDGKRGLYFREDSDLAFRVLDAGFTVHVAPDVVVEHPQQFASFRDALRHTRRYELDALLYKKHPCRYRQLVEVRSVGRVKIRRPMHYVCILYGGSALASFISAAVGRPRYSAMLAMLALMCSTAYRFRYQGASALRLTSGREIAGFALLPWVYLYSLGRGARRFKAFGVLR